MKKVFSSQDGKQIIFFTKFKGIPIYSLCLDRLKICIFI